MKPRSYPITAVRKIAWLALALLFLLGSTGLTSASSQGIFLNPPALAHIELPQGGSLERLAQAEMLIYAHLYRPDGSQYLLAPLSHLQQIGLQRQGYGVRVLDPDTTGAVYYLLSARQPEALQRLGRGVTVLEQEANQALVRAAASQVELLAGRGVHLQRLRLHKLALDNPNGLRYTPQTITPDPIVQTMINQVQSGTVFNYNGSLSGEWPVSVGGSPYTIATRWSRTVEPIDKATQYTYERFQSLGLSTSYHYYDLSGSGQRRNVIAEQTGLTQPNRIFLVTAHLDSTSDAVNRPTLAPGADDNASGSTAVMIAADILSQYDFGCTLRYALFTGEEQGLIGSDAYATFIHNRGDNVEGVLNLDMIAYNSDDLQRLDLHTRPANPSDLAIANLFVDVLDAYNINLDAQIFQDGISYSDHYSFWSQGYPAILGIEDDDDFTPYYHTINDRLESLDMTYYTNFVRAAIGTFAHMGCLMEGQLSGVVTNAYTGQPVSGANVNARLNAAQAWATTTAANGFYRLVLPPGLYQVTASAASYIPYSNNNVPVNNSQTTSLQIPLLGCRPVSGLQLQHSPPQPGVGQTVTFTATAALTSTVPVTFNWDFGDNSSATGAVVTHVYDDQGVYNVSLSGSNCAGLAATSETITIIPVADITLSQSFLDAWLLPGESLTSSLTISNSGHAPLDWSVQEAPTDVGWLSESPAGGSIPALESATLAITYTAPLTPGIYTSQLAITSNDPDAPLAPVAVQLVVLESPCQAVGGVDFTFAPAAPLSGQTVNFTSTISSGTPPITFTWNFGDGSPPLSGQGLNSIQLVFPPSAAVQTYPVSVTASNGCSALASPAKQVVVQPVRLYLPLMR